MVVGQGPTGTRGPFSIAGQVHPTEPVLPDQVSPGQQPERCLPEHAGVEPEAEPGEVGVEGLEHSEFSRRAC